MTKNAYIKVQNFLHFSLVKLCLQNQLKIFRICEFIQKFIKNAKIRQFSKFISTFLTLSIKIQLLAGFKKILENVESVKLGLNLKQKSANILDIVMVKRKRSTSQSSGDTPRPKKNLGDEGFEVDENFDENYFAKNNWHLEAGSIEYIKMTNFMCHAKFDYYPDPKINFITGENGSGKSALMSALIFGLGGTAKMTNRGKANKNFIRTGQTQASVEISLYNVGENAYRPVSR